MISKIKESHLKNSQTFLQVLFSKLHPHHVAITSFIILAFDCVDPVKFGIAVCSLFCMFPVYKFVHNSDLIAWLLLVLNEIEMGFYVIIFLERWS